MKEQIMKYELLTYLDKPQSAGGRWVPVSVN